MAAVANPATGPRQDDVEVLSVNGEMHCRATESIDSAGRVALAPRSNAKQEVLSC